LGNIFEPMVCSAGVQAILHFNRHQYPLVHVVAVRVETLQLINGGKVKSWSIEGYHFPEDYPIYDSFVEKMLMHFKRVDKFFKFKKDDLKYYPTYHAVLMEFSRFYGLEDFTLKQIDKYLWQAGKDYFPKQY